MTNIHYHRLSDEELPEGIDPAQLDWQRLTPDKRQNWLHPLSGDFETFLPLLASEETPLAIFSMAMPSLPAPAVAELSQPLRSQLEKQSKAHIRQQNKAIEAQNRLENLLEPRPLEAWSAQAVVECYAHPLQRVWQYQPASLLPPLPNHFFVLSAAAKSFYVLLTDRPIAADFIYKNDYIPRWVVNAQGDLLDNITQAALRAFREHYSGQIRLDALREVLDRVLSAAAFLPTLADLSQRLHKALAASAEWSDALAEELTSLSKTLEQKTLLLGKGAREKKKAFDTLLSQLDALSRQLSTTIAEQQERQRYLNLDKDSIFYYTCAVLHDANYREQYAEHLRQERPRLPFYPDFWAWVERGRAIVQAAERLAAETAGWEETGAKKSTVIADLGEEWAALIPNMILTEKWGSKTAAEWAFSLYSSDKKEAWICLWNALIGYLSLSLTEP